jgi:hypothetical protein
VPELGASPRLRRLRHQRLRAIAVVAAAAAVVAAAGARGELIEQQRCIIESRWVSQPLALAGGLRPPRLNHRPHLVEQQHPDLRPPPAARLTTHGVVHRAQRQLAEPSRGRLRSPARKP